MVYNTKFQAFPNARERQALTPNEANYKFRLWSANKEKLASEANTFGGRRLLGVTDKNKPIWLSFHIDRETLNISMKLSHDMDTIRKSKLCPRGIRLATGEQLYNLEHAMRPALKTDHGEVTQRTLDYIEQVMIMCESSTIGKVKTFFNKSACTKSLFMIIANLVYHGSVEVDRFRWRDVMATWDMPAGEYLTVDG